GFVRNGDVASYICAAGVLAHYIGDACQPLHVSMFHHGHPHKSKESAVHNFYETTMLDEMAPDVIAKVNEAIGDRKVTAGVTGGDAAADLVVSLMRSTIERLDPEFVVNTWLDTSGPGHAKKLWAALGDQTAACMADGALCLATVWQSAWIEGKGDATVPEGVLDQAVGHPPPMAPYNTQTFPQPPSPPALSTPTPHS